LKANPKLISETTRADDAPRPSVAGSLALIRTAERLFALHGIEGVPLRRITQESGHRNMSAAQYHFGSRSELVQAVLSSRMVEIDQRRRELLDEIASQRAGEVRDFVFSYISPLAEQLNARQSGNYYLRFLAQYRAWTHNDWAGLRDVAPAGYAVTDNIRSLLAYLPPQIVELRFDKVRNIVISALAEAEAHLESGTAKAGTIPLLAANLTDMVTGSLLAPVSAHTLDILRRQADAADR
jgi:AcrR family transcriptional regulator